MASVPRSRFGATIRTGRIARGWTQRQLADRAGVPQSVVSAVETGGGGELATLERVCVALGGELRLEAHLSYAGDGSRQVDLGHARCVGAARRLLEASGCARDRPGASPPPRTGGAPPDEAHRQVPRTAA